MIFNRLFQRAHLHSNPSKRLAAVESLNAAQEKDLKVLHELAFNDESLEVSLAALSVLNSFTLWLKAYESHFNPKLQQAAKAKVLRLLEDEAAVPQTLFNDLVQQHRHNALVREMLFQSKRLQQTASLCVQTLLVISTETDVRRFYTEIANDAQKRMIIDALIDLKSLKRLKKLDNSVQVASYLDDKLGELALAAQKPAKVRSAARLINSRLLALADLTDYAKITQQKQQLLTEFDAIKSEFTCLNEDVSAELTSKYFTIKEKVDKRLALLAPDYMATLHIKGVNDALLDIQQRAETIFGQVELLTESDTVKQLDSQVELLTHAITDLALELSDLRAQTGASGGSEEHKKQNLDAHQRAFAALSRSFEQHLDALKRLPERIERNRKIDALIVQTQALVEQSEAISDDSSWSDLASLAHAPVSTSNSEPQQNSEATHSDIFTLDTTQVKTSPPSFSELSKQIDRLIEKGTNASRLSTWRAIKQTYAKQNMALQAADKRIEKRCLSKLNACLNMIEQGKFKVAMSTFHTAQGLFKQVHRTPAALIRRYEEVTQKISELKDWQSYIAAPRKPQLLASVTALINNQQIEVSERAALVKQYRREFASLGRLHTVEDDELNRAFDVAIESAFAPCRAHFAKQDELRQLNYAKGQQILEALDALASVTAPLVLNKHLQALSQQYRKLGDMEKQTRSALHKDYKRKVKPLQAKVTAFYQDNAAAKQSLINKIKQLAESEDIEAAVAAAKAMQADWKSVGFAGRQQDATLWQAFREANDILFARFQDDINAQRRTADAQLNDISSKLASLSQQLDTVEQPSQLNHIEPLINSINELIYALPKQQQKTPLSKLSKITQRFADAQKSVEVNKQTHALQRVFDVLFAYTDNASLGDLSDLPSPFKQALEAQPAVGKEDALLAKLNRQQLAFAADVLMAQGQLYGDSQEKKHIQLSLMAAKLEGQTLPTPNDILAHWISRGPLSEDDAVILSTLKTLYLSE